MSGTQATQNPFPGLRPFTQEEDYLFFGREEQTIELLQRLAGNRFVAVVGTSGSGKSSLVRCGLLSELLGGKMLQAGAAWEVAVTHPGGNPMALLTEALLEADLYDIEEDHARENLLATLSRSHFGLVEAIKQSDLGDGTNFLLVVDQFEEIFRFHEAGQLQQEIANEFVSLLLEAAAQSDIPIYIVLTMRSDFIGECGQFEGLAEMVNRGEFLIPRLTREQYKRVIEGPVKVAGGKIAPRLLQRLLNDLGQQADQLPCLQHALMRTWDVCIERGDGEALDLDDYQRVGKMAEAMSLHADEIYDSLDNDRQRDLCRGIFQALTVQESENRGIRRPQRLAALCNILEVEPDELRPIIDAFRQSGVTFLIPPDDVELDETKIVDISHESLMRVWTRLRGWVEEEAQAAGIYRRLSESASLHTQDKAGLYRDPELGIALAWKDTSHPNQAWADRYSPGFDSTMEYLDESHQAAKAEELQLEEARQHELEHAQQLAQIQSERAAEQSRAAVRLRWLVRGVGVVAIIALLASIFALFARRDAQRHATVADRRATEADSQRKNALDAQAETAAALIQAEEAKAEALVAEQRSREFRYATDLQLASVLLHDQGSDVTQALSRLVDHDPAANDELDKERDLRGFEWHYLKELVDARAKVYGGYEESLIDVTLTANGQIVGLDEDGWVHRWDATNREILGEAVNAKGKRDVSQMALSPDGSLVALAAKVGKRVWLIDAETGDSTEVEIPFVSTNGLSFSPDGKMLITVGTSAAWWDVASGKPLAMQIKSTMDREGSISLSADGRTLAISRQGSTMSYFYVLRMNPETREVDTLIDKKSWGGSLGPIAVSGDGKFVAVTQMFQGSFVVFDTTTGLQVSNSPLAHAGPITSLTFNPEGEELASSSQDGAIKVWANVREVESPEMAFSGHAEPVNDLCFVSGGSQLVSTSSDLTTRLWDRSQTSDGLRQSMPHARGFQAAFSDDRLLMAVADFRKTPILLYDAQTLRPVRSFDREGKGLLTSVAFSPDGRLLAAGFGLEVGGSQVELWDIDQGERVAVLVGAKDVAAYDSDVRYRPVSSLAFSPDGTRLVAGFGHRFFYTSTMQGSIAKVWDVESRREVTRLKGHDNLVVSVAYSADGRWLATASYDGTTRIWDTNSWKTQHVLDNPDASTDLGHRRMLWAAFSPNSRLLATASHEGNVHVWSVETGELVKTLKGHANGVDSVAFSPDGRTIASAASDQTVRLWNVATWRELTRLELDATNATAASLTFSPDGSRLFSSCSGVRYWEIGEVAAQPTELSETIARMLDGDYDLEARVRMLGDRPGLVEALQMLAEQHPDNGSIQEAIAIARTNQFASRQQWSKATNELDQLAQIPDENFARRLGAPVLLRSARALFELGKPSEASVMLRGGAKRLAVDGIQGTEDFGIRTSTSEKGVQVLEIIEGYPGQKAGLLVGDIIETVNGEDVTGDSVSKYASLLNAELGELTRLGVRRKEADELTEVEVLKQVTLNDAVASDLIRSLEQAVDEQLAASEEPSVLLELRAELAGLWPDRTKQLASYTAAIDALTAASSDENVTSLARLRARRGDVLVHEEKWSEALNDYSTAKLDESADSGIDEETQESLARARAEVMLSQAGDWTYLQPTEFESAGGAKLELLDDGSILASGKNPDTDTYHVDLETDVTRITALRLEALTHDSLPSRGPGRGITSESGGFRLSDWTVQWAPLDRDAPLKTVELDDVFADYNLAREELTVKQWNTAAGNGEDHFAVYKLESPIESATGIRLTISMTFHDVSPWTDQNLGRFRLSANDLPDAFESARLRNTIEKKLAASLDDDAWSRLAFAHHANGDEEAVTILAKQHPDSCKAIGDMYVTKEEFRRAIAVYDLAIDNETTDVDLISARARAYEQIKDWDAASADWARVVKLATGPADPGRLSANYARRLAKAGQRSRAMQQFDLSRRALEADMEDYPDSETLIGRLAAVLADRSETISSALKPSSESTEAGKELKLGDDHVIVVESKADGEDKVEDETEQERADTDAIVFIAPEGEVKGLKIETSSDEEPGEEPKLDQYQLSMILDDTVSKQPGKLHGRYVRISIDYVDQSTALTLAEVQVLQEEKNLAVDGTARQSSVHNSPTAGRASAERAIDGNTNGAYVNMSVTHTKHGDPDPWWEVDLGDEHDIDQIVVWNRTDNNYRDRMKNFYVQVIDASHRVVLEQFVVKPPSPKVEIQRIATAQVAKNLVTVRPTGGQSWQELGPFRVSTVGQQEPATAARHRAFARSDEDARARLAVGFALSGETDHSASWFNRAIDKAKGPTTRHTIAKQLLRHEDLLAAVTRLRPDDIDLQVAAARRHINRGNKHLQADESSDALREFQLARQMIDRLLTQSPEVDWSVLQPTEMLSSGGADLKLLPGGSILASGLNPDDDTYTITVTGGPERIRAFRIEALPHQTFRNQGPGRYEYNGTFRMNELRVFVDDRPVELRSIVTNFDEADQASDLIDGVVNERYWGNDGSQGRRSWVVVTTDLKRSADEPLKFELALSNGRFNRRNLGHFRISATGDSKAPARTRLLSAFEIDELIDFDLALGKAYAAQGQNAEAAVSVARALEQVSTPERLNTILDGLTEYGDALEALAPLRPDDVKLQFSIADAHARKGRSLLNDNPTDALPELEFASETYSRLLGDTPWTVLAPQELSSAAGVELSVLPDQSILSSAGVADGDTYAVTIGELPSMISGLRLETIPDPSLPGNAAGWAPNLGNFGIEEFRVFLVDEDGGARTSIPITDATSSSANQNLATRMVDDSLKTHWAVWPSHTERQHAIFELGSAVTDTAGKQLVIEIASGHDNRWQVGRFRLSAMRDARAVEAAQILQESSTANGGVDSSKGLDLDIGAAHIAIGNSDSAALAIARAFDRSDNEPSRAAVFGRLVSHDGLLEKVGEIKKDDLRWSDALYRFQLEAGKATEADAALKRAQELYEMQLKKTPGSGTVASELADLLHLSNGVDWKTAKPVEFTSEGGADLELLDDQSVLASGKNPPTDTYRVVLETDVTTITAIRLDVLTHDSLPGGGPGRGSSGRGGGFKMSSLTVEQTPLGSRDNPAEVVLSDVVVDHFLGTEELNVNTWNIHPQVGKDHHAVFELQSPIESDSGTKLVFTMTFHPLTAWADQNLGRFRISVSSAPTAFSRERDRLDSTYTVGAPLARLATEYWSMDRHELAVDTLVTAIRQAESDKERVALVRDLSAYGDLLTTAFERMGNDSQRGVAMSLYQAQTLADDSQLAAASEVLTKGLAENADNLEMLKLRAQIYRDQHQWSDAAEDYDRISQLTSAAIAQTAARNRASMLARDGQWDAAADLFAEQMLLSTDWDTTRNTFACHLMAGNTDAAAVAARWLLQRVGNKANAYWSGEAVRVAITLPGVIDRDNRQQLLERAGASREEWRDLLTAAVHYRLGDLRKAVPLLEAPQGKPQLKAMAAMLLRDQGKNVEAAQAQREVARWFSNQVSDVNADEITNAKLASRAMIQSVYDEAAEYGLKTPRLAELNKILTDAPDDILALVERSRLLAKEGLQRRAEVDRSRAKDLAPKLRGTIDQGSNEPQHFAALAEIAFGDQNWEDSMKLFDQAVEFGSDDAWILFRRAEIHAIRGHWDLAVPEWQRAFEKQPDAADQLARRLELAVDGEHWPIVAEDFGRQLDQLDENRKGYGTRHRLLQTILLRKDPVFAELEKQRPTDTLLHIARARDFALRERWNEAADAYAKGIVQTPDLEELYEYAAALLLAGRDERFAVVVAQLGEQAEASGELTDLFAAARAASLIEEAVLPWKQVRLWARKANDGEKQAWFMHGAGLAAYRDGDLDQAAKWFESSSDVNWHAELNNLGLCLVYIARDELDKARAQRKLVQQWIEETSQKRADSLMRESCTDWLELNVLIREADQLLAR